MIFCDIMEGKVVTSYASHYSDDPAMYEDYLERDRVKFRAADEDQDGKLSRTEFPFFMYPEQHQFMTKHVVGVSVIVIAWM